MWELVARVLRARRGRARPSCRTCCTASPARARPKSTCRRWRRRCGWAGRQSCWCPKLRSPRRPCGASWRASPGRWGWCTRVFRPASATIPGGARAPASLPVIVGPRSALFTPLPNLGLIVVDEFHDETYYQDDFPPCLPRRGGRPGAGAPVAARWSCSARPPRTWPSCSAPASEGWPMLRLPVRILAHRQAVEQQFGRLGMPAPPACPSEGESAALELPAGASGGHAPGAEGRQPHHLQPRAAQPRSRKCWRPGQQAILFLNRRGTATYVFCRDCGASLNCPRCDLPAHLPRRAESLLDLPHLQLPPQDAGQMPGLRQRADPPVRAGHRTGRDRGAGAASPARAPCAGTPRPPARRTPTT